MDSNSTNRGETSFFASGIRTALFVVVIGTVAAVVDHTYFVAPRAATAPMIVDVPAAPATGESFALPAELRPTQADVAEPAPTF